MSGLPHELLAISFFNHLKFGGLFFAIFFSFLSHLLASHVLFQFEVNDEGISFQDEIFLFLISLHLNLAHIYRKRADQRLCEASEEKIVDIAGEGLAEERVSGKFDGEGDAGVDIGIASSLVRVRFNVSLAA